MDIRIREQLGLPSSPDVTVAPKDDTLLPDLSHADGANPDGFLAPAMDIAPPTAGPAVVEAPGAGAFVFIDSRVDDLQDLIDGAKPGVSVFVIDGNSDGLQQIADILAAHGATGLAGISIVSHGSAGEIEIGTTVINDGDLADHGAALSAIGAALAPGGDLNLFACNTAQGDIGHKFIADLAAYTHADVAAATHNVGSADTGASWTLDAATGTIETGVPFTDQALTDFEGSLAGTINSQIYYTVTNGLAADTATYHINSDATTQTKFASTAGYISIAVDTAAGLMFTTDGKDGISVRHLSDGSLISTTRFGPQTGNPNLDDAVEAIAINPITHQLYVGDWGTDTNSTGIRQFTYNASTGALTAKATNGGFLFTATQTETSAGNVATTQYTTPWHFSIDVANNRLYYGDNDNGYNLAPYHPVNSIYTVDLSAGTPLPQLLTTLPSGPASGGSGGGGLDASYTQGLIGQIVVDPAHNLVYFATSQSQPVASGGANHSYDSIYYVSATPTGSSQTATKVTLSGFSAAYVNSFYPFESGALALDPVHDQIYITNQNHDGVTANTSDISIAQVSGDGHTFTLVRKLDMNTLVGRTLQNSPPAVNGETYDTAGTLTINPLPVLSVTTSGTHATEQGSLVAGAGTVGSTDILGGYYTGATIQITGGTFSSNENSTADDRLSINGGASGTVGAIAYNYNSATETLTLTGYDAIANYNAMLALVTYGASGNNPTNYGTNATRTLTWTVSDGAVSVPAGQQNSGTSVLTIDAVNDATTLATGSTITYVEQAAGAVIDNAITVSDPDNLNEASATVTISAGFTTGDTLNFTNQNGITGSYNSTTHILTLTGSATLANYQAALRSVTFSNSTNDDPTATSASRTISFVTNDGGLDSNAVTSTINITPVNDAPTGSLTGASPTFIEDGAAQAVYQVFSASTVETGQNIKGFTLTVTNVTQGAAEFVVFDGASIALTNGNSVTTITNGFGVTVSLASGTATVTITKAAGVSAASFVTLLAGLSYRNASQNPTVADRVFTLISVTDTGGTANGGQDTVFPGSVSQVHVQAVNDAPTAVLSNHNLGPATEQTAFDLKNVGLAVADMDGGGLSETVTLAVGQGVLNLTAGTSGAGVSGSGTGTVTITGSINQINALLNTDGTSTVSYLNSSNTPSSSTSLTLTVHDNGNTGGGDLSGSDSGTIAINGVNDVPTFAGLNGTPTFTEDGAAVVLDNNATVTDLDLTATNYAGSTLTLARSGGASAQDVFGATGTLSFTGSGSGNVVVSATTIGTYTQSGGTLAITFNSSATQALVDTALQGLTYSNNSDNPPASAVIAYAFSDGNSGSQGTGGALVGSGSVTVTITAADDAPVAVGDTSSVNENATVNIAVVTNDTDVDGGPKAVAFVDGQAITTGNSVTLASGATVKLESDGTLTYDPNGKFNYLVSAGTAGTTGAVDSNAADSFSYTLNGGSVTTVNVTVNGIDGAGDQLRGSSGSDSVTGTSGSDLFNLSQGGTDTAHGGDGDDGFYFSAGLDATDTIDGEGGTNDQVGLQGNFTYTFGANNLLNIETLAILSGHDTRFGDNSGANYAYNLTTVDANVAAGQQLIVNGNNLAALESLTFNGSAEQDGSFFFYAGLGTDSLTGSQQSDGFFFGEGGRFAPTDHVDGQGGADDQLGIRGDYSTLTVFTATSMVNIETLALLSATDSRFAPPGTAFNYNLKLDDGNVASGATLTVSGNNLRADESMSIDGSSESNGHFRFWGGQGADTLTGGGQDDQFTGGLGKDTMTGNGGNDTFYFRTTAESAVGANADRITDFTVGDHIDLSQIDADTGTGGDQAFTFLDTGAFTSHAGEARITGAGASWTLQVDTDGNGVADMEIAITTTGGHTPVAADFIL